MLVSKFRCSRQVIAKCMLFFLIVSVVLVFIFFLLKLLAAKDNQEYSQLLMENDCFDILCRIDYRGLPTKEKVSSWESVITFAIKKGFLFSTSLLDNERGRICHEKHRFCRFLHFVVLAIN